VIPRFSLAIPHTPWVPERVETLARLEAGLDLRMRTVDDGERTHLVASELPPGVASVDYHRAKAANHVWSGELWRAALGSARGAQASHVVQLQDDVIPAPRFWQKLAAMVEAHPAALICLENPHPGAMTAAREGKRWYQTIDGLIGVGYVLPFRRMEDFLGWRSHELKLGTIEGVTEDSLLAMFAVTNGIPVVCPIPTIIDHDTSIASTYAGNDAHPYRRPSVTWEDGDVCGFTLEDLERPEWWAPTNENTADFGAFYDGVVDMSLARTKHFSVQDAEELKARTSCAPKYARFFR